MKLKIFGIARDLVGARELEVEGPRDVGQLRDWLSEHYNGMRKLSSYMVAVNQEYATDEQRLEKGDEVAIIPPVSGG